MEDIKWKKYPVIGGLYKHYKGGTYKIITLAKHSETNEDMVVYKSTEFGSIHARPLSMWFDPVMGVNSRRVARFEEI